MCNMCICMHWGHGKIQLLYQAIPAMLIDFDVKTRALFGFGIGRFIRSQ